MFLNQTNFFFKPFKHFSILFSADVTEMYFPIKEHSSCKLKVMEREIPAEWMSADPSGSMAKFPKARAARFCTVSRATFLFRISTTTVKNIFKTPHHFVNVPVFSQFITIMTLHD